MPIGDVAEYHGTEADGAHSADYCRFCYQKGKFTLQDITLQGMIDRSVSFMVSNLKFSNEDATALSTKILPSLKRWKK